MSIFGAPNPFLPSSQALAIAKANKRCEKKWKALKNRPKHDGKKFIAKPEMWRAKFRHVMDSKLPVRISALSLDSGEALEVKVWVTNEIGDNRDIGEGYEVRFEAGGFWGSTKVSTSGQDDAVVLFWIG